MNESPLRSCLTTLLISVLLQLAINVDLTHQSFFIAPDAIANMIRIFVPNFPVNSSHVISSSPVEKSRRFHVDSPMDMLNQMATKSLMNFSFLFLSSNNKTL